MLQPGVTLGPYTLSAEIGRGAHGTVWLAERRTQIATTRVAIKIPMQDRIDLEAITAEAQVWIEASGHPNVMPIIEANVYDGLAVIVSEFAGDGSLATWIADGRTARSASATTEMFRGILSGLMHLHDRGIVHRDVKPSNILMQGRTPRLTDFGIARLVNSGHLTGTIAGTPAYMAPEAFDGQRTVQTDVWASGVVLYELLTGSLPFVHSDVGLLIGAIKHHDPGSLPPSTPEQLRTVATRCLQKDLTRRYAGIAEIIADLDGRPQAARPATPLRDEPAVCLRSKPMKAPKDKPQALYRPVNTDGSGKKHQYVDKHDGTLYDRATGLTWQRRGRQAVFGDVPGVIAELNSDPSNMHRDWRLPTVDELMSLWTRGQYADGRPHAMHIAPLFDLGGITWSADVVKGSLFRAADEVWGVHWGHGTPYPLPTGNLYDVLAVRSR